MCKKKIGRLISPEVLKPRGKIGRIISSQVWKEEKQIGGKSQAEIENAQRRKWKKVD
jgi:hypothetical protein